MKYDTFVGREKELEQLKNLKKKRSASLVVVRGRRRVGKSRLVEEFAKGKTFFSFAGLAPTENTTKQDQRDVFAEQLGAQIGLQGITATDWATLFSLLAKQTSQGNVIILFDEISWMGSEDPTFVGKLKNAWDREFKKNPNLMLVLCGSVSTWIEKNIISSTAFFGRISLFLKISELPLNSSYELLYTRGFHRSSYEAFKLLSVMGGIPWYLEQVQPDLSVDAIIKNLCFDQNGILFNEFEKIFHDLFEKRSKIYRPIIETLANGSLQFNQICKNLGYSKSGTISEYLEDLIQSGFISKDQTWSLKSKKPIRVNHYRLSDNYLRFYLKYIAPNIDRIEREGFDDLTLSNLPGWGGIMGLQFENLVLKNRKEIWKQLGIHPADIVADNPYFQKKSISKEGCQIDYLIQTRFNTLFACEIKFSIQPLKSSIIPEIKNKLDCLILPKRYACWPVLIHVNGTSRCIQDSDFFSKIIDFNDLLKTEDIKRLEALKAAQHELTYR